MVIQHTIIIILKYLILDIKSIFSMFLNKRPTGFEQTFEKVNIKTQSSIKDTVNIKQHRCIWYRSRSVWPRGYKTFFKLNSTEHVILPANKFQNGRNQRNFHV